MEFKLLGPLEVVDGGQPVPIPSVKHRVLLASLLVHPGELVTVDTLAEAIWGDAPPANPRTTLQTYVSRLRQRLHLEEVLQSRPGGYVLAAARGDIDVGRFEILVEQASQAARAGDRRAEAALSRQALALWRGVPLADVPSEMLQRNVIPQLVEQRLSALQRRIEADLALGRHAEVVAELRALTDQYPLRERAGRPAAGWLSPAVAAVALAYGLLGDRRRFMLWRARVGVVAGAAHADQHRLASFAAFVDARVAAHTGDPTDAPTLVERAFADFRRGRYEFGALLVPVRSGGTGVAWAKLRYGRRWLQCST